VTVVLILKVLVLKKDRIRFPTLQFSYHLSKNVVADVDFAVATVVTIVIVVFISKIS
jgi:hypothetical protein